MQNKIWLITFNFLIGHSFGGTVVTGVTATGFDSGGTPLTGTPANGLEIYNATGTLLGTWNVATGQTFTANQDENNRNEASSIQYNINAKSGNTSGADDHAAAFASFNAGANPSDSIVIESEALNISVTWNHRDLRFRRQDMTAAQTYDLTWTITSFENVSLNTDLGTQTTNAMLTSLGVGASFGFTGHSDDGSTGNGNQIVPTVYSGDVPTATLAYSGAAASGQLTGKYDGSDFNLTLRALQSRDTSAAPNWLETMDGDPLGGDPPGPGMNPSGQMRAYLDADYDYLLTYSTFTFVAVPEPTSSLLLLMSGGAALFRRRR